VRKNLSLRRCPTRQAVETVTIKPAHRKEQWPMAKPRPDPKLAPKQNVSDEWDKEKLRTIMKNARRLARTDAHQDAFRQLCRIDGRNIEEAFDAEFAVVMCALEEALSEESAATRRSNRAKQKPGPEGMRQTLTELALKPKPSMGFVKLMEFGMGDMSAEALVVKYPDQFEAAVVIAAQRRLEEFGLLLQPG
jgi:hypothetical protein